MQFNSYKFSSHALQKTSAVKYQAIKNVQILKIARSYSKCYDLSRPQVMLDHLDIIWSHEAF